MDSIEYRAFLDLLMCSDPWPVHNEQGGESGHETLKTLADRLAVEHGFSDWIDAYHEHAA